MNDGAGSAARSDCHAAAPEPPPAAAWRSGDANAPLGSKSGDNGTDATSAMLSATATQSSAFGCHAGAAASRRSSRSRLGRICRPVTARSIAAVAVGWRPDARTSAGSDDVSEKEARSDESSFSSSAPAFASRPAPAGSA